MLSDVVKLAFASVSVTAALSGATIQYIIAFDENCHATLYSKSGGSQSGFQCKADPVPKYNYDKTKDTDQYIWPGDLEIDEPKGGVSDYIRFIPDPARLNLGARFVLFYSDTENPNDDKDLADKKFPAVNAAKKVMEETWAADKTFATNAGDVTVPLKGKTGVIYTAEGVAHHLNPGPNDPVGLPGAPTANAIVYIFLSDADPPPPPLPEPSTELLIGVGTSGILLLRYRFRRSVASNTTGS